MEKRILFLLQVPPPVHGASLRNLSLVQSNVLQESFKIKLLPLHFVNKIEEIGSVSLVKFWRLIKFLFKLTSLLIFWRPRFVYFTISPIGNAFYRDVLIVVLVSVFRVQLVYHLRGLGIAKAYQKKINRPFYDFVFKKSFVVCLSESQREDIRAIECRHIFIVPNGIKLEGKRREMPTTKGVPEILFLSNYIRSKGVLDFIEVLNILHQRGLDFKARMIGAPWDVTVEDLVQLAESNGIKNRLEVSRPLFGTEKFDAIMQADIFVLPTYYELFPGVVLEAMQCGKPIVSTLTGAIPEIIDDGKNGFLVPTKNPIEMANKVELLILNCELRKEIGDAAYSKFMKCYTLDRFEENMKNVFEQVLNFKTGEG